MDLNLKGKVALVTGVGSRQGCGWAIAMALAEEGADVACCANTNIKGAEAAAQEIRKIGRKAIGLTANQGEYEQVKKAVQKITRELGTIDILVNNAGKTETFATVPKLDVPTWDGDLRINLSGPYYWLRETFSDMAKKGWGRIVSISSIAATNGNFGQSVYCAAKGGLISLMKTAALEGAKFGITANTVVLGPIATEATIKLDKGTQERLRKRMPAGKMGEPADVAGITAFLCSDRAKFFTGTEFILDGGSTLYYWYNL